VDGSPSALFKVDVLGANAQTQYARDKNMEPNEIYEKGTQ